MSGAISWQDGWAGGIYHFIWLAIFFRETIRSQYSNFKRANTKCKWSPAVRVINRVDFSILKQSKWAAPLPPLRAGGAFRQTGRGSLFLPSTEFHFPSLYIIWCTTTVLFCNNCSLKWVWPQLDTREINIEDNQKLFLFPFL